MALPTPNDYPPGFTPTDSSTLKAYKVTHKGAGTVQLEVCFKNNGLYSYQGIPEEVLKQFEAAPSKGIALNDLIKKPGYPCEKLGSYMPPQPTDDFK